MLRSRQQRVLDNRSLDCQVSEAVESAQHYKSLRERPRKSKRDNVKFRYLAAVLVIAESSITVPNNPVSAAGAQTCLSGDACVAHVSSGSTVNGFISSSISNFSSFYWNNPKCTAIL